MVVVIRPSTMEKYVGNNLKITLLQNTDQLTFVGNNIRVNIKKNDGKINIVGDNCRVIIQGGAGEVKYTGNNGKFDFGDEETGRKFVFTGNNVRVNSVDVEEKNQQGCDKNHRTNIIISDSKHVRIRSTRKSTTKNTP